MNLEPEVQITLIIAVTVLILVLIFKDRIIGLTFGKEGASIKLADPEVDVNARSLAEEEIEKEAHPSAIHWDRSGDLFWLGNDLMWTKTAVFLDRPNIVILEGLRNSLERARALGFSGTFGEESLSGLINLIERTDDIDNKDLASRIETIKQYIASRAEGKQSELSG